MPKSFGQKQKILYLARFFMEETDEKHPASMASILNYLERAGILAERKSIYSDIEALRLFGFDIIATRGKDGGYFLGERNFELPEVRLLVDAVQSSRFLTQKKSKALIRKLSSLTSRHEGKILSHNVCVAGRIKNMDESIYRNVDTIANAIEENKKISFSYFEWDASGRKKMRRGGEKYIASPFFLLWDNENYYLIAVEEKSGEKRHFRVDKMIQIEALEDMREGKALLSGISPADYEKKSFGMFGGKEERVSIWWQEELAGVFYDRFGTDCVVQKSENGGFISSLSVMVSPVFYSFLMGFGDKVKILSPEWVKEEFVALAENALKPYQER
jgi:predicted DNA-binding transcriptional regulator YafY